MSAAAFASIAGQRASVVHVHVPYAGAWVADVDLDDQADLSGAVELVLGGLTLRGTIAPAFSGSFQLGTRVRVVGGAGAWCTLVKARQYHSDAGVKASTVVADLARDVGETVDTTQLVGVRVGVDFAREVARARDVLVNAIGALTWWVGYDGVTRIGTRTQVEASGDYEVLDFDPRTKVATISVDDPSVIGIGTVLRDRLERPLVVRELAIDMTGGALRLMAWGDDTGSAPPLADARLLRALRAIARSTFPAYDYLGPRRYRVVKMNAGRVDLQIVRAATGFPDLVAITMHPGMAGLSAVLTPGALVVVQFLDGDPTQPMITHFEPAGGPGFLPVSLALDAQDEVRIGETVTSIVLGAGNPPGIAREGDAVHSSMAIQFDGTSISLVPRDTPGALNIDGVIASASTKARAE